MTSSDISQTLLQYNMSMGLTITSRSTQNFRAEGPRELGQLNKEGTFCNRVLLHFGPFDEELENPPKVTEGWRKLLNGRI